MIVITACVLTEYGEEKTSKPRTERGLGLESMGGECYFSAASFLTIVACGPLGPTFGLELDFWFSTRVRSPLPSMTE